MRVVIDLAVLSRLPRPVSKPGGGSHGPRGSRPDRRRLVCACFSAAAPFRAAAAAAGRRLGVLPVDEYPRAARARQSADRRQPPRRRSTPRSRASTTTCASKRRGRRPRAADHRRAARRWTRVQIPAGLMVRDAQLDGQPVSLVDGPPPHVLLSRAGPLGAHARHRDPAHGVGGQPSRLRCRPRRRRFRAVTLALPRSGVDLRSTGGFVAERAETADRKPMDGVRPARTSR